MKAEKKIVWRNEPQINQFRELLEHNLTIWRSFVEAFESLELDKALMDEDILAMRDDWNQNQSPASALKCLLLRKIEINSPSFGKIAVSKQAQLGLLDLSSTVKLGKILEKHGADLFAYLEYFQFDKTGIKINAAVFNVQVIDPNSIYAVTPDENELLKRMVAFRDAIISLHEFTHKYGVDILMEDGSWGWNDYKMYDFVQRASDKSTEINRIFYQRIIERLKPAGLKSATNFS